MRRKILAIGCVLGFLISLYCALKFDFTIGVAGMIGWALLRKRALEVPDLSDFDREWMEFSQRNSG
jgi:hypothetical protein